LWSAGLVKTGASEREAVYVDPAGHDEGQRPLVEGLVEGPISVSAAFEGSEEIAKARHLARLCLTDVQAVHGLPVSRRAMGMVQLVVSERVTNARKYAPGPCLLTLMIEEGAVQVSVWDSGTAVPAVLAPDPSRIGQHGLESVMAVCQSIAVHREPVASTSRPRWRWPMIPAQTRRVLEIYLQHAWPVARISVAKAFDAAERTEATVGHLRIQAAEQRREWVAGDALSLRQRRRRCGRRREQTVAQVRWTPFPNAGLDCLQHLVIGHAGDDRGCRDSAEREERIGSSCIELLRCSGPIGIGGR
jgi:hypothetical protein